MVAVTVVASTLANATKKKLDECAIFVVVRVKDAANDANGGNVWLVHFTRPFYTEHKNVSWTMPTTMSDDIMNAEITIINKSTQQLCILVVRDKAQLGGSESCGWCCQS